MTKTGKVAKYLLYGLTAITLASSKPLFAQETPKVSNIERKFSSEPELGLGGPLFVDSTANVYVYKSPLTPELQNKMKGLKNPKVILKYEDALGKSHELLTGDGQGEVFYYVPKSYAGDTVFTVGLVGYKKGKKVHQVYELLKFPKPQEYIDFKDALEKAQDIQNRLRNKEKKFKDNNKRINAKIDSIKNKYKELEKKFRKKKRRSREEKKNRFGIRVSGLKGLEGEAKSLEFALKIPLNKKWLSLTPYFGVSSDTEKEGTSASMPSEERYLIGPETYEKVVSNAVKNTLSKTPYDAGLGFSVDLGRFYISFQGGAAIRKEELEEILTKDITIERGGEIIGNKVISNTSPIRKKEKFVPSFGGEAGINITKNLSFAGKGKITKGKRFVGASIGINF